MSEKPDMRSRAQRVSDEDEKELADLRAKLEQAEWERDEQGRRTVDAESSLEAMQVALEGCAHKLAAAQAREAGLREIIEEAAPHWPTPVNREGEK